MFIQTLKSGSATRSLASFMTMRPFSVSARAMESSKKQFIVIARDYKDAEALNRRLSVRARHMSEAKELKQTGALQLGGALLTDHTETGKMVGSIMIFQAESKEEVAKMIAKDQYVVGKVWEHYDIHPFRQAPI